MRILFVIEFFGAGGRERRLVELVKGLNREYLDVELHLVVLGNEIAYQELNKLNIKIHSIEFENNFNLFFSYFKLLRKIKPVIVQTWTIKTSTYFSFFKAFFSYKLLTSYVADSFGYRTKSLRIQGAFIYQFADKIIGNSISGMNAYKIPLKKRIIIYNGYDTARLERNESREEIIKSLNIKTPFIVLMVANLSKHKDYITFLQVARTILKERKDISFISVGGGEYFQEYKGMLDKDEEVFIKFLGHRSDVDSIIEICNIGLLCTFSEGVSNAILEYMMHKKPVIATGTGGTKEIVENGKTGFILPASSPKIVSDYIIKLIDNNVLCKEMGMNGFKLALKKFSLYKNTAEYYRIYKG